MTSDELAPPHSSPASGRAPFRVTPRTIAYIAIAALTVLAEALHLGGASSTLVFLSCGAAISGLAWLVGVATEHLGSATGPKLSGVLNVAFGNAAELVITIFALRAGLLTLVRASIAGSILGNLLLVLGVSILVGGMKNGTQRFSRLAATTNASVALIAVVGLIVPAIFATSAPSASASDLFKLSTGIALVLMVVYLLSLLFFFKTPSVAGKIEAEAETASWSVPHAITVLALTTVALAVLSEALIGAVEPALKTLGLSEAFTGLIVIPIIGNAAEHLVAVQFAYRNDVEFTMVVSLGSSLQVALFVAPLLVLLSHLTAAPLTLVFSPLEIVTVGLAVLIVYAIASDGRSNWFEGVELLSVYGIIGIAFWFFK